MIICLRRILAVIFAIVFIPVFIAGIGACLISTKASDEKFVPGILEQMDVYNFVYDDVMDAAIDDLVTQGIKFGSPNGNGSTVNVTFDDPEKAKAALRKFIETVLPREYVKQEIDQAFAELQPYLTGRTDIFSIDLQTDERILAVPAALRAASTELSLGQIISDHVISVLIRDRIGELVFPELGISFTDDEAIGIANRIMPPDWIEQRIFETADAIAPYLAGDTDSFEIRVPLKDRVKVVGEELKIKVVSQGIAEKLVYDQVARPLIQKALGGIKVLSFDIPITPEEVDEALKQVLPPDWVRARANEVIDAAVAYLSSDTDSLAYSVDLRDRKAAAVVVLRQLAEKKLTDILRFVPSCSTPQATAQSLADLAANRIPRCSPANLNLPALVSPLLPLVLGDLDRLVANAIPDRVTYTDEQFRATLGPDAIKTLDDLRDLLQKGVVFTDQDLLNNIKDPQARADIQETLDTIRAGATWDQTDLRKQFTDEEWDGFDKIRGYGDYISLLKWAGFLLPALFLIIIGFLGGRSWGGRLLWAGIPLLLIAIIFFAATQVADGRVKGIIRDELTGQQLVSDQKMRENFPALTRLLESDKFRDKALTAAGIVTGQFKSTVQPWLAAGVLMVAGGIAALILLPSRRKERPPGQGEAPAGSAGQSPAR